MRRPLLGFLTLASLGGCAAEPAEVPEPVLGPDEPTQKLSYPRAGISFEAPRVGRAQWRPRPGVTRVRLGESFVSVFAYDRGDEVQMPRDGEQLALARQRLVAEVRRRDPRFSLVSARATRVDGAPAIELVGDQTIARSRLRTRSVHVFKRQAEYVIEMAAPVEQYRRLRRNVFDDVVGSVEVTGRIRGS